VPCFVLKGAWFFKHAIDKITRPLFSLQETFGLDHEVLYNIHEIARETFPRE